MKKIIKYMLPERVRTTARDAFDGAADFTDRLRGRKNDLVPPRRMIRNIGGDFTGIGDAFFRYFVGLCGLQPDERVLDVGCGVGRMAVPLTKYLGSNGSYDGFDIDAQEIEWCTQHITSRYRNFQFRVADIYSKRYNPRGVFKASEYKFPFADNSFDFVFLTSVFTHVLPPDLENYLSEISRVLDTNGRCFITFFFLNAESLRAIEHGNSSLNFRHDCGEYRVVDQNIPEEAVAFSETFVRASFESNGLSVQEPVRYGSWCDRAAPFDYQDIVVATKL